MNLKRSSRRMLLFLALILVFPLSSISRAASPGMTYQGYLKRADGMPASGQLNLAFSLYTTATGGAPVWTESQSVPVTDGMYSVVLGKVSPLPSLEPPVFLGLRIAEEPELAPRQEVTSSLFSLRALLADTVLDGAISDAKIAPTSFLDFTNVPKTFSALKTFSVPPRFAAASGTAPFAVDSPTLVPNLNADMVGGQRLSTLDTRYLRTTPCGDGETLRYSSVKGKWLCDAASGGVPVYQGVGTLVGEGLPTITLAEVTLAVTMSTSLNWPPSGGPNFQLDAVVDFDANAPPLIQKICSEVYWQRLDINVNDPVSGQLIPAMRLDEAVITSAEYSPVQGSNTRTRLKLKIEPAKYLLKWQGKTSWYDQRNFTHSSGCTVNTAKYAVRNGYPGPIEGTANATAYSSLARLVGGTFPRAESTLSLTAPANADTACLFEATIASVQLPSPFELVTLSSSSDKLPVFESRIRVIEPYVTHFVFHVNPTGEVTQDLGFKQRSLFWGYYPLDKDGTNLPIVEEGWDFVSQAPL